MGGHNTYTFTGNTSQVSYRPFKFSGESDYIKALRKEALVSQEILAITGHGTVAVPPLVYSGGNSYRTAPCISRFLKKLFKNSQNFRSEKCYLNFYKKILSMLR